MPIVPTIGLIVVVVVGGTVVVVVVTGAIVSTGAIETVTGGNGGNSGIAAEPHPINNNKGNKRFIYFLSLSSQLV